MDADAYMQAAQDVDLGALMRYTADISQWERLSGTDEEKAAFDYIEGKLRGLGAAVQRYACKTYISLPVSADIRMGESRLPCTTHSMAASTPPGGIRASLEYVGNGSEEAYRHKKVDGKIVLIDGLATPGKTMVAAAHGAAGAIFLTGARHVPQMILSPVWGSPSEEERHQLPALPVVSVGREEGTRILDYLARGRAAEQDPAVTLATVVDSGWREIPLLIGEICGATWPQEVVLLSGHVDSWYYGAMDNASANAVMLEVARLASKAAERGAARRTLRVAFWSGHSHGRYAGSAWYADNFWEDIHRRVVVHINVDSPGARGASLVTEAQCMGETREVAAWAVKAVTGEAFRGSRFGRAGDQSFWAHGVPSLFMTLSEQPAGGEHTGPEGLGALLGASERSGGLGWWWHTPEDMLDKIDPSNLLRDAKIYALVTLRFLGDPISPLDFREAAREVVEALHRWASETSSGAAAVDLLPALREAEDLRRGLARSYDILQQVLRDAPEGSVPEDLARAWNGWLMRLSRALVPLRYTDRSPFFHDPALATAPVPALSAISRLHRASPEDVPWLATGIRRKLNQVMYQLRQAADVANSPPGIAPGTPM